MHPWPVTDDTLMFLDARTLSAGEELEADICIVGAGAAGIALALELRSTPLKVLLVESGGLDFDHRSQLLYRGRSSGREYPALQFTHRRQFGGTMRTWFGRCRPLDEMDFQERPFVPGSGWPFTRADLDPYYARAHTYCQLDRYDYDADHWPSAEGEQQKIESAGLETKIFQFSPPTDFGKEYRGELARASNIQVCLHANVKGMALDKALGRVSHARCLTLGGKAFTIKAGAFVLAAGGLEVTRLLLASDDVLSCGIGNQNDLVGRFFMEHPHIFSGVVTHYPPGFSQEFLKLNHEFVQTNLQMVKAIGIPEARMLQERVSNASAFFLYRPIHKTEDAYFSRDAASARRVAEVFQHAAEPSLRPIFSGSGLLRNARSLLDLLARAVGHRLRRVYAPVLRIQMESIPNPESRITLSDKKDALGNRQIDLHWQLTQQDLASYCRFADLLHNGLRGLGFQIRDIRHDVDAEGWPVSMIPAKHQLGTTRMHRDPRQGVVDPDCRVHGVENLYVASGSVFPTGGMANPTLTIIALAVRLADHLKHKQSA
jgi:choline dehydrogenase-like flavoprotein